MLLYGAQLILEENIFLSGTFGIQFVSKPYRDQLILLSVNAELAASKVFFLMTYPERPSKN